MPGKVKVRILAGRNLPVMDKSSDTSDAFVEVKLGNTTYKTEVFRRSLNPFWNSEWFRFEVDDEELQDEPLQIRIMDYDTYSANDAIGKVYIDLNPLLSKDSGHVMSGWFPIYDTMHGIRGEVNCVIKVALFSDANRYRQSSCGFKFFYSPGIPSYYSCQAICGFVEELVVNHDPEYQWIDKIRTPRASNEARQTLFSKISGEVQRKIGLKAIDLGGNAVVSYQQYFDMEGESGIVVRGIGTAVLLSKMSNPHHTVPLSTIFAPFSESPNVTEDAANNAIASQSPPFTAASINAIPATAPIIAPIKAGSPNKSNFLAAYGTRRLSDSDLSTTPKANSVGGSHSSGSGSSGNRSTHKFTISPESLHLLEYPFITMKVFPTSLIQHIGGVVSARSVKLLDQINNPDEPETRDAWWTELRKEIRSHTRALACNSVLGYSESTYICDEICILSASGTAAILRTSESDQIIPHINLQTDKKESESEQNLINSNKTPTIDIKAARNYSVNEEYLKSANQSNCCVCHIPYCETSVPFPATLVKCSICKKAKVPDVLFMTIEPPPNIPITGHGTLIQARVCRSKRETKGELCAKELSDGLPFLEYELHRQLLSKLKVKGMNGLFGISIQVSFGENMLIAIATGTGAFLSALPPPTPPKISSGKGILCSKLNEIQSLISESIARNRENYDIVNNSVLNGKCDDKENIDQEKDPLLDVTTKANKIDLTNGNKETCVLLEVDDTEDADIISLMIDSDVPKGYEICNCEKLPGMSSRLVCNLQMFSQVFRAKLTSLKQFGHQFDWVIQSIFVKFRRLIPCCVTDLKFRVDLPEADVVQITVVGTAVGIAPPLKVLPRIRKHTAASDDGNNDLMFAMDEDQRTLEQNLQISSTGALYHCAPNEHYGIELTPLSYIPGGHIVNYFGNLDFFFIRESTSIREYGGLNCFMHSFITETLAIVRAHVSALGGNAMTAFHITQLLIFHNPHKNQAQCLINVAGDAVTIHYGLKDKVRPAFIDETVTTNA